MTTRPDGSPASSDLVERAFKAGAPTKLWVADITCIPTWVGFVFLAVARRQPVGVILHSDHGCQFKSVAFGQRCRQAGVVPSTGSIGDAYDNPLCESFLASPECELLDRQSFQSHAEARMAVFRYIEGCYNPHRCHSGLDRQSLVNCERRRLSAA